MLCEQGLACKGMYLWADSVVQCVDFFRISLKKIGRHLRMFYTMTTIFFETCNNFKISRVPISVLASLTYVHVVRVNPTRGSPLEKLILLGG